MGRTLRQLPWLLRRTLVASADDGLFALAKAVAYSGLLSLFPIITTSAALFIQMRAEYVQQKIAIFLSRVLPPGAEEPVLAQFRYNGQRPRGLLIVAVLISLWAASSVIKSLIDGFNAAYRVPRTRSMLAHIGIGLVLVPLSAIPMLGASSLILFGGTVEHALMRLLRLDPTLTPLTGWLAIAFRVIRFAIAFGAFWTLTAILYYFGPFRKQRWRGLWGGAFLATILWLLATMGFSWYVRHITNYNLLYGSIGTGIALLIWMYLLAIIALFGCEFNAERERMRRAESVES
ncbi:MAG TPA: YihY/virulence factor BrkB family protein [Bryobacteraceae bacterium]|nr:YihY/virulence factor BrkB family protein [Bryobacteraceae bacterium]